MADGTWIQYNSGLKRYDKSINGGGAFSELDLTGQSLIIPPKGSAGPIIFKTTLTGNQNDFSIPNGRYVIVVIESASDLYITGVKPPITPQDGDIVEFKVIYNITVYFHHASASSSPGAYLINWVQNGLTPVIGNPAGALRGGSIRYIFMAFWGYWAIIGHEMGGYLPASQAIITASGFPVAVTTYHNRYCIRGRTLFWNVRYGFNPQGGATQYAIVSVPVSGLQWMQDQVCPIFTYGNSGTGTPFSAIVHTASTTVSNWSIQSSTGSVLNYAGSQTFWGNLVLELL